MLTIIDDTNCVIKLVKENQWYANGKANITFYQSDDLSKFVIQVVGQGENGKFGQAKKEYEVKVRN